MDLLIFGDQTSFSLSFLQQIASVKGSSIHGTFLTRATSVLRSEIRRLPHERRQKIPNFGKLLDLFSSYQEHNLKVPELEAALLTISQIAWYMKYFEDNPHESLQQITWRCLGLCTGTLAAAAILSATSLSDLNVVGLEAVKVAFRAGAWASIVGSSEDESNVSWSNLIADISAQTVEASLNNFHAEAKISGSSRAYISCFGSNSVTISGPPGTTKRLFEASPELKNKTKVALPVYAPYHARHLFQKEEIRTIIDEEISGVLGRYRSTGMVHSSVTGKCHGTTSTADLFRIILDEMLGEPVHWDKILASVTLGAEYAESKACRILAVGPNTFSGSLISSFRHAGVQVTLVDHPQNIPNTHSSVTSQSESHKIAIVGIAGRFPSAANHDELWELLTQGLDVHKEIPKDRFDVDAHYDPSGKGKNKTHSPYGCFIDEPGLFDPRFFNMSPREAAQTDPMARLAIVTAYEALEMSGFTPNRTPSTCLDRIGTFYGQTSDDWREINAAENIDTYFITGGVRAFAPGRINYYFKFSGPSYSIDTACSSSLAAVQLACTSLLAGECDTACAGGVNVLTNPDIFSGLSKGQFLSKTGQCKTFDNDADGYCRADGAGTLILKRYSDALADNDNVLGCILASATNHSAEAVSITHPHAGAQEFLYKKILADSGISPDGVSYCELHGTGTQAGDHIEMESITNVFASKKSPRKPDNPLYLGSLKANIGHGEAASGFSAMVKCLLMLREDTIPLNIGIKGIINQTFPTDLKERNVQIPFQNVYWPKNQKARKRILVNNFSAAGGNTAVLLEEAQVPTAPTGLDPRETHVITISARSVGSLRRNLANLIQYIDQNPQAHLPSLSYTTTARRIQHNYRIAVSATSLAGAREALSARTSDEFQPVSVIPAKVIFAFTGQGVQYAGLARSLYMTLASFRNSIDSLDRSAQIQGLPSLLPLITEEDISRLSPVVLQVGLACVQISLAKMWESWGIVPTAVIGHSLGEYAALHIAGVISANAMIRLVGRRAQLLESHCTRSTHGMLAINAEAQEISRILGPHMLEIACKNSLSETVLCGTIDALESTVQTLAGSKLKSTLLNVDFAFHSAQVDPILEEYRHFASSVEFHEPKIPILSTLTGDVITTAGHFGPEYLARHARETVDFTAALDAGSIKGIFGEKTVWLEVGAHPILSKLIKRGLPFEPRIFPSLKKSETAWQTISSSICGIYQAGVNINFNEYHSSFEGCHQLLVLPTYAFDNKTYWLDYHNNWTLTKGETPAPKNLGLLEHSSKFSTTSCQRIISETFGSDTGTVVVQSDLTEPKLAALVSGHVVNGVALVPSSLYADMALTIVDYLYQKLRPNDSQIGKNVCDMEVFKPLIATQPPPQEGQHIQLEASADLKAGEIRLKIRSVSPQGILLFDHGTCLVKLENVRDWLDSWQTNGYMVQTQIDLLKQKLETGNAHKVLRGLAYKLFSALVTYDPKFQGIEEVVLDAKDTEATALISFQTSETDGDFFCSPYWIDSLCHISGFVVNATDIIDSAKDVYISHGWKSMRFARSISREKQYRSYVRMQPQGNNIRVGDVYIFEGSEIVGKVGGVKFQQIPRRLLNTFLPRANSGTGQRPEVARKAISQPAQPKTQSLPAPVSASSNTIVFRALEIVASETGVDRSELVADAAFDNLGIDSLMSLSMATRFTTELGFEVPASMFTEFSTIGELTHFFSQYEESTDSTAQPSSESAPSSRTSQFIPTPQSCLPLVESPQSESVIDMSSEASAIHEIISKEMGIDIAELADDADLASMGMDSLMSLTILTALRESFGVELPSTFLLQSPTIREIEFAMGISRPQTQWQTPAPTTISKPSSQNVASGQLLSKIEHNNLDLSQYPTATSILLQGNPKTATKILFLLPDGSGSATSYMRIPSLDPSLAIYALNCPFMKTPQDFLIGVPAVCSIYRNEIRRLQPHGPYHIGGWSAGGVMAYEVALGLLAMNEIVSTLFLIDSPCPIQLAPLPVRLFSYFDNLGLLGSKGTGSSPEWLIPHFEYSVKNLGEYEPQPLPEGTKLRTVAIWAKSGVGEDGKAPPIEWVSGDEKEPRTIKWLLEDRTDFGDNGWGQLLGKNAMEIHVMDGNHFTMMGGIHAATLGNIIKQELVDGYGA